MKCALCLWLALELLGARDPREQPALDRISEADLRGNLSFLASDLLEGRDTPSRGLDIAAEFIASQFRDAGLEPIMQTADYLQVEGDEHEGTVTLQNGKKIFTVKDTFWIHAVKAVDLADVPLYKAGSVKPSSLTGKVAYIEMPEAREQGSRENIATYRKLLKEARAQHPAAILIYSESAQPQASGARLVEAGAAKSPGFPTIAIWGKDVESFFGTFSDGASKATLTVHAKAPSVKPVKLRNVAALLKGSDPELADTYILVTAHYDHIGIQPDGNGDRICNGANDDGSGTVSVIELAKALAAIEPHPRRSILFLTFFGEEKGLYGSRYYAEHPLYPLKKTIAQINLEQLGRTDSDDGPQVATATFTGFEFSDLPAIFAEAGKSAGVKVYEDKKNGDAFFARSDNQSLADAGVPAHTVVVAFEFPDYHKAGDEWQKIDYGNMARVDRMIALGVLALANSDSVPKWNESDTKAEKYLEAWHELHP